MGQDRRRCRIAVSAFAVMLAAGFFAAAGAGASTRQDRERTELLVALRAGTSAAEASRLFAAEGATPVEEIAPIRTHLVRVAERARDRVAAALAKRKEVEFVEPNRRVEPVVAPNDPYYGQQWHLPKIGAPSAWEVTTGSAGVAIAILDSGVDAAHPDLAAKLLPGWNFYDGNADTSDVYGHGTKVAGAATASSDNGIGVAAPSWGSFLMPIRVTNTSGYGYYSSIAQGITWSADHGARVMNVSFAGVASSSTIASAARYARGKSAIVVTAAGNCGCDDPTQENPDLLSVGSTTSSDGLSSFSSRGLYVDLSAPGSGIWTTARGGGYSSSSGTSFASPVTAGVIALMFSANPDLSPAEIESLLESTAVDLGEAGDDTSFGFGRIDAAGAVAAALGAPSPPPDTTPPSVAISKPIAGAIVNGMVTVEVTAFDDRAVVSVELRVDGALLATDETAPWSFAWDTTKLANGSHALEAIARDAAGNAGSSGPVVVDVQNATSSPAPKPGKGGGRGKK